MTISRKIRKRHIVLRRRAWIILNMARDIAIETVAFLEARLVGAVVCVAEISWKGSIWMRLGEGEIGKETVLKMGLGAVSKQ